MVEILHINADDLLLDSFRLGRKVYESGFRPKHAISIWRGGTPIGLGVDAYFRFQGLKLHHTSIATSSYTGIGEQGDVVVKGLEHLTQSVCPEDGLLIIDDVYETGRTIQKVVETLRRCARRNCPKDIRVAVVHDKNRADQYRELPVLALKDIPEQIWIDYPHELADLVEPGKGSDPLIMEKSPAVHEILQASHHPTIEIDGTEQTHYVSAQDALFDSMKLGVNIARSGYLPDFLVALWPGGVQAGLVIHEVFKYFAKKQGRDEPRPDHIALNTTSTHLSYRTNILGLDYLLDRVQHSDQLLIVDTVFRSGRVASDVVNTLKEALRRNLDVENIKLASVYWNPDDQSTWTVRPFRLEPDFYLKKGSQYVVYPHAPFRFKNPRAELIQHNPELASILFD
jgi:hypoxanthine phosphoribosyltransferase